MALTTNTGVVQTFVVFTPPIEEKRFVKGDGTLCGAGEKAAGVSMNSVTADSKTLSVCLTGVTIVTAGGTCTAGTEAESNSNGKAINLSAGKTNGVFLDSGSTDDEVRILVR